MKLCSKTVIGNPLAPLMIRYVLFRCEAWGIYIHKFLLSDYDRALHDHPWPFVAIVLKGGYHEEHDQTIDQGKVSEWRAPGSVLLRPAEWRHRIVLPEGKTSWSLVIVGRRQRRWGFVLPDGWCWWRQHNPWLNICEDKLIWNGGED